jgi:hypothetical protein
MSDPAGPRRHRSGRQGVATGRSVVVWSGWTLGRGIL